MNTQDIDEESNLLGPHKETRKNAVVNNGPYKLFSISILSLLLGICMILNMPGNQKLLTSAFNMKVFSSLSDADVLLATEKATIAKENADIAAHSNLSEEEYLKSIPNEPTIITGEQLSYIPISSQQANLISSPTSLLTNAGSSIPSVPAGILSMELIFKSKIFILK